MGASTGILMLGLLAIGLIYTPALLVTVLVGIGVLSLVLTTGLKAAALAAQLTKGVPWQTAPLAPVPLSRLPKVSMLVPLYREDNIADALITRLTRLTYPKALLEVVLVLEAKDTITRDAIARTCFTKPGKSQFCLYI